jgi:hypothetical protein
MGKFWDQIRRAVEDERYVIGQHANERLRERGVPAWQIISGVEGGILLVERPRDKPNPIAEVRQYLPDGTAVKAVWSWLKVSRTAKLVTVHFLDGEA